MYFIFRIHLFVQRYLSKKRKENFKYHFFKYHHFLYSFILSVYQIRMFVNKCKKEILF